MMIAVEIVAAAEALRVPSAVDLAAIVIGALTGGLLAALRVLSVWRGWETPVAVDLPQRARSRLGSRSPRRRRRRRR